LLPIDSVVKIKIIRKLGPRRRDRLVIVKIDLLLRPDGITCHCFEASQLRLFPHSMV